MTADRLTEIETQAIEDFKALPWGQRLRIHIAKDYGWIERRAEYLEREALLARVRELEAALREIERRGNQAGLREIPGIARAALAPTEEQ